MAERSTVCVVHGNLRDSQGSSAVDAHHLNGGILEGKAGDG